MTEDDFKAIHHFFEEYTGRFIARHPLDSRPYALKKEHSLKVCKNTEILSQVLGLSTTDALVARTAGLLHDMGRFRQYETWNTFSDPISANHGILGVEDIETHEVLENLSQAEKQSALTAIRYHNVYHPPEDLDSATMVLIKILRDADKIDIYRVVVEKYLEDRTGKRPGSQFITHSFEDDGTISEALAREIFKCRPLDSRKVRCLNDLKLLHISWLFDLSFEHSIRIIHQKKYMDTILKTLPALPIVRELKGFIRQYMDNNLSKMSVNA